MGGVQNMVSNVGSRKFSTMLETCINFSKANIMTNSPINIQATRTAASRDAGFLILYNILKFIDNEK